MYRDRSRRHTRKTALSLWERGDREAVGEGLRQVLRSEFVQHRQLYEFLELNHYEWCRQSFAWRVRRLLRHGLLVAQHLAPFGGDLVYSVTPLVAQHLQANGESCLFSVNRPRPNPVGCLHAVELNETGSADLFS
jgi:hypothetical protein